MPELTEEEKLKKLIHSRMSATFLDETQRAEVEALLLHFSLLWKDKVRKSILEIKHHIRLTTERPVVTRSRYNSKAEQEVITKELEKMLFERAI